MFGLTFEKLFVVAIVAGLVIGPTRLPAYAQRLADTVGSFRAFMDASRARAAADLGEWTELDPRRYDPRRLVREALDAPAAYPPSVYAEAARVRPGQRYLVTGSAAHPQRVLLDSLPPDDPRRLAAQPLENPSAPASSLSVPTTSLPTGTT
ncbi:hypothetical protein [Nocardioides marmoraquaticus]